VVIPSGTPDERYVRALYTLLLGRPGSNPEVAGWLGGAPLPVSARVDVALGFLHGQEYREVVVRDYYTTLLHRPASPEEVNGWVFSGLDLFAIRLGFEASPEFFSNA
jgi:hypothetical protein